MDGITIQQLNAAVERGIITADQRDRLLALGSGQPDEEHRPGFNAIYLAYYIAAGAVLFALGWFLVDRWKSLHPGGVLAVAMAYATAFTLASVLLARIRFHVASSLFALLAVGMAPIVAWCIESLAGLWPSSVIRGADPFTTDVLATIRWIPIELSAALAALIALRRVHFSLLALAVAIPFALALVHLTPLLFDPELDFALWGWMAILASTILMSAGYVVEQRTGREPQDYARFVYLTAMVFLVAGVAVVAGQTRVIPHSLPAVVLLLAAHGLALRRVQFLATGLVLLVGYLGFLAANVFKTAVGFMVVVVAAGTLLMVVTVVIQRRYPGLLRKRADATADQRVVLSGARFIFPGAILAALILLVTGVPRARTLFDKRVESYRAMRREAAEARRAQAAIQRTRQRVVPPETTGQKTP
ncbi:MAG: hypothetical protein ACRENU_16790 [Gemmatimonadaceae bacterium]